MAYNLSITGDCNNIGVGAIELEITDLTPPYLINWYNPNLGSDISPTGSSRTNLFAGTYFVEIIDSSEPTNNIELVNITVSSGICASLLSVQGTSCGLDTGSVTASSTTNLSTTNYYLYNSGGTFINSGTSNIGQFVFSNLSAATYYVVAEDLGGCSASTPSFIISYSRPVDFGFYVVPDSPCGGTFPTGKLYVTGVTGTPPFTYLWNTSATGSTITGLTSNPYSVTVTDSIGCSASKSAFVDYIDNLGFVSFSSITPTCFASDGSITLRISGGTAPYYYSASTGAVLVTYSQEFTLTNLPNGSYLFNVTDAGLCSLNVGTELFSPGSIATVSLDVQNSFCSSVGGSLTVSVTEGSPPYVYQLIYPDSSSQSITGNQSIQYFDNLSAGTYTIAVSDQTGCAYIDSFPIIAEDLFTIYTSVSGTTCNIDNGSIQVSKTSGGTSPFTFSLDGISYFLDTNQESVTFTNVSSGQHFVEVQDATGCTQSTQVIVPSSTPLQFTVYSTSCGNGNNGKITTFISSGQPPFTFNWSDNVTGNPQQITVSGLTGGTYTVEIVDSTGCSLERESIISCFSNYSTYTTYLMGSQTISAVTQTQFGLLQMLNDGFRDLTENNTGCVFNSASFIVQVKVQPLGLSGETNFFTTTSLNVAPGDNLYYTALEALLLSVPGVSSVSINPQTNEILVQTNGSSSLLNQTIIIDLKINYDISCLT